MQDNIIKINELLIKFYLTEPATIDVQRHIRKIKRSQFNKILKRAGTYSIVFGAVAGVYFSLKKLGIVITIYKSAIIAAAVSTVIATGLAVGTYKLCKHVFLPEINKSVDNTENIFPLTIETPKEEVILRREDARKSIAIKDVIGIQEFSAEGVEADLSRKAFNILYLELGRLRGSDYIIDIRKPDAGNTGMALKGSVELLNGTYNISVKVISIMNLNILYYNAIKVNRPEEIDSACLKLAGEVAEKFPVKN